MKAHVFVTDDEIIIAPIDDNGEPVDTHGLLFGDVSDRDRADFDDIGDIDFDRGGSVEIDLNKRSCFVMTRTVW